jgi:deoxyribonuclease-2
MLAFFALAFPSFSSLSCKDPTGKNIDWFAMFKFPENVLSRPPGTGYFYHDDQTPLHEDSGSVTSTTRNPLYHTLAPVYSADGCSIGYVMVSDQPPDEADSTSTYAHMKGVILFDEDNGLYLTTSVPHFPPDPALRGYEYPSTGTDNGQSFQCMSLEHYQIESMAKLFLIARPWVYAQYMPPFAKSALPSVASLAVKGFDKSRTSGSVVIQTRKGKKLTLLAKSGPWGQEFYHDLVAPTLKADLIVEGWRKGSGNLPTDCSGSYKVYNAQTVKFGEVQWVTTKDHSKWAVGGDWVCIGDINRQKGQMGRGGTTFCNKNKTWAKAMKPIIVEYEGCPA